jgi:hypothetical protein
MSIHPTMPVPDAGDSLSEQDALGGTFEAFIQALPHVEVKTQVRHGPSHRPNQTWTFTEPQDFGTRGPFPAMSGDNGRPRSMLGEFCGRWKPSVRSRSQEHASDIYLHLILLFSAPVSSSDPVLRG